MLNLLSTKLFIAIGRLFEFSLSEHKFVICLQWCKHFLQSQLNPTNMILNVSNPLVPGLRDVGNLFPIFYVSPCRTTSKLNSKDFSVKAFQEIPIEVQIRKHYSFIFVINNLIKQGKPNNSNAIGQFFYVTSRKSTN